MRVQPARFSPGLLSLILFAHAAVLLVVAAAPQASIKLASVPPLTVSLIELQAEAVKPEPRPQPAKPQARPPVVVAEHSSALSAAVPTVEPPRAVVEPVPQAAVAAAAAPTPAAVPQPPVIEPRLDADYLNNPKPPYPSMSRRLGEQGAVHLRIYVNADGSVAKLELKRSSGFARLDQSAMNTVQSWRFVPARQGSQPIAAWVVVPIQFTLGS